jgi:DNA-binding response OmpR family regulator
MSDENMHDRVLLVTEDLQAGGIWAHALGHRGVDVDVVVVESAADALRRWAEEAFELVIVDIYTRQLDGIALCRHLRTESTEPILLLTPTRDEAHLLEAYQAGVDECIVKPVSPLVLVAKVLAWLRSARAIPAAALPDESL